jgi:hypothetical protein
LSQTWPGCSEKFKNGGSGACAPTRPQPDPFSGQSPRGLWALQGAVIRISSTFQIRVLRTRPSAHCSTEAPCTTDKK